MSPDLRADLLRRQVSMKPVKMSSGAPFLPIEVVSHVLKRLPVKSLIRFQCVCSLWKNLIKSPSFIASHLDHPSRENPSLIFRRIPYSVSTLYRLDRDMQLRQVQNNPFIDRLKSLKIVGSCNGLLCVQIEEPGTLLSLYLWNPATREVIQVPKSRTMGDLCHICSLGFAFIPTVNDYIIVIPYMKPTRGGIQYGFEVYSLAKASWKKIEMPRFKDRCCLTDCITLNGSMFWLATNRGLTSHEGDYTNPVASLYLENDEFRLIPPPPLPMNTVDKLTVYENRLAIFHYSQVFNTGNTSINLWVIEEGIGGPWSKILTCGPYPYLAVPLTIWSNQIVCNVYPNYSVERNDENDAAGSYLFDPTSNEVKVLYSGKDGTLHAVFTYVESLVLISNIHTGKH